MRRRNGMNGNGNGNNLSMRKYMSKNNNYNQNVSRFNPLQEGDSGPEVEDLQTMLLDLAHIYPTILILTIDGNFGGNTKTAVSQFQEITGCECTGIVDEKTWNKIKVTHSEKCKDVRITSILQNRIGGEDSYDVSSNVIREGSTGKYVTDLQEYLNVISTAYPSIIKLNVDGIFGPKTKSAVFEFQKLFGLPIDGIVGQVTWDKVYEVYRNVLDSKINF